MGSRTYDWWRAAIRGARADLAPGNPQLGFYRNKSRAVAIKEIGGRLVCEVSSGYQPRHDDEIDDLFGFCSTSPITYEVYQRFMETGRWPEDIDDDLDRARIGHNSNAALHEQVQDEIETVLRAFSMWLKEIGDEIKTEEQDKKGEEFKTRIMALSKQASDSRVLLKKPFLEGGRLVDKTWMPIEEMAENGKSVISSVLTPYRVARQQIRNEESALLAELIEASPIVAVPHRRHKPKTGLRTTKVVVIDDLQKAATQLAGMKEPPEDFVEAVRSAAKKLIDAGIPVDGVHIEERKKA